jgi:hypothetical protein
MHNVEQHSDACIVRAANENALALFEVGRIVESPNWSVHLSNVRSD